MAGWFARLPAWQRIGILVLAGAVAALGQAPTGYWPATLIALAGLLAVAPAAATPRQLALVTWCFALGYFAVSLRWIIAPFLVDAGRHGWMAPFALVLMAVGAGLFWALAGWLAARLAPQSRLMLALMLTGAEIARSLLFTGFPWALLGHVWLDTGVAQLAAFIGPHGLTLCLLLCAWVMAANFGERDLLAYAPLPVLVGLSYLLSPGPPQAAASDAPLIRLVQPNAPQDQKWDPAYRDSFVTRMEDLSAAGPSPDLVVWPETAVPYLLNWLDDDLPGYAAAAQGAPLVFGVQRRDADRRAFNSLVVLGSDAEITHIYDKRHLVPFGEYMPGAALLNRAGAAGLARNLGIGFTPGARPGPIEIDGIGLALPLICYEGIFAEEISYGATRPRLMLLITNDAWFGAGAGPAQHLAQARLRAIEQGLPMVRVANTGISAMIDARGRITGSLPLGETGALDAPLPPALAPTLYARFGDAPVFGLWIFFILATLLRQRRKTIDLSPPAP